MSKKTNLPTGSTTWVLTNSGTITLIQNNRAYTAEKDHPNKTKILELLRKKQYKNVAKLFSIKNKLVGAKVKTPEGKVESLEIRNGKLFLGKEELRSIVAEKILELWKAKKGYKALLKFLEKVLKNPSKESAEALYNFVTKYGLVITKDGDFVAYKSVRKDFKDWYSGTFDNSIGTTPNMKREDVDPDRNVGCSYGLHIGAMEYVKNYKPDGNIVRVECSPEDVVSVPYDCEEQKIRVCQYKVVELVQEAKVYKQEEVWDEDEDDDDEDCDLDENEEDDDEEEHEDEDFCRYCNGPCNVQSIAY